MQKKCKLPTYKIEKIDSPEKAYILGFICCDGTISTNKNVEISVCKADREVVDYIADIVRSHVFVDNTFDKKTRRFPRVRTNKKIGDINKFIGGYKKSERHLPIVPDKYNRYLMLGAFDADGCITWGRRKDKNRIWQKITFNTSLSIAVCIQKILIKELNISTIIRPKSNKENCYVIEFSNKKDVMKFIKYIYCDDFIVLKRKYLKAKALRLELEENGESDNDRQYRAELAEQEGVETSGAIAI